MEGGRVGIRLRGRSDGVEGARGCEVGVEEAVSEAIVSYIAVGKGIQMAHNSGVADQQCHVNDDGDGENGSLYPSSCSSPSMISSPSPVPLIVSSSAGGC